MNARSERLTVISASDATLFAQLEKRAGGAVRASSVLCVSYRGSYAAWKAGRVKIPRYIVASIRAHLLLDDDAFRGRCSDLIGTL